MQKHFLNQKIKDLIKFTLGNSSFNKYKYGQDLYQRLTPFSFHKCIYQYTSLNAATKTEDGRLNLGIQFSKLIKNISVTSELERNGLKSMFPIQQMTYELLYNGNDLLASDRTGSGKTLAYSLPILERFRSKKYHLDNIKVPRFLILCPTRELACQVTNEISRFNKDFKITTLYGGASITQQINDLERGVDIIAATPGRLIDMIERGTVKLENLETVCLDEADTMLQKGFKLDIERIFELIQKQNKNKTQNIMFSATIPDWVDKIARQYFAKDTQKINLISQSSVKTPQTVKHYAIYNKNHEDKSTTAKKLIEQYNQSNRTIIFTETKVQANKFIRYFDQNKIAILHGDISQSERQYNLNQFRSGRKKILIATDVAARGLDIPDVQLVIQLSPPRQKESFIHRSGRTGRAGKNGVNITLFNDQNIQELIQIERMSNLKINFFNKIQFSVDHWLGEIRNKVNLLKKIPIQPQDKIYQKYCNQILQKCSPQQAIIKFLKSHKLVIPQVKSVISQKNGYISLKIQNSQIKPQLLKQKFKQINLVDLQLKDKQIIFDISINQYEEFLTIAQKQSDLVFKYLQEKSASSLTQFAKNLKSQRYASRYNQRDNQRNDNRRSNQYSNSSSNARSSPSSYSKSSSSNLSGQNSTSFFLSTVPQSLTQSELKNIIEQQLGFGLERIKIVRKIDDFSGNAKCFAFVDLKNPKDCGNFINSKIIYEGKQIRKRVSNSK